MIFSYGPARIPRWNSLAKQSCTCINSSCTFQTCADKVVETFPKFGRYATATAHFLFGPTSEPSHGGGESDTINYACSSVLAPIALPGQIWKIVGIVYSIRCTVTRFSASPYYCDLATSHTRFCAARSSRASARSMVAAMKKIV